MPSSPRGVRRQSGQENGHACPVGTPGRCGHRPLQKATCVPTVCGDAHIAPQGTSTKQSGKTDMPVPSVPRADVGIGPYEPECAAVPQRGLYRPSSVRSSPCHHHFLWYSCHWQLFQLDSLRDAPPQGKAFHCRGFLLFFLAIGQGEGYNGSIVELTMDN